MEHLRYFENQTEYDTVREKLFYPNVSYVEESDNCVYAENYPNEIMAKYSPSSTSKNTTLLCQYSQYQNLIKEIWIDDIKLDNVTNTYKFPRLKEYTVKYVLIEPQEYKTYDDSGMMLDQLFNEVDKLIELDLSHLQAPNEYCAGIVANCPKLTTLNFSMNHSNYLYLGATLVNCPKLSTIKMFRKIDYTGGVDDMSKHISSSGTFIYNKDYDYSYFIEKFITSTWETIAI